ncbi:hypothetical protein B0186_03955 [Canicola haemoglobinophilus]|uniref:Uncharacterized protein n=1 Tax=Canicola haemoglobinophilus TaxID=733 RepID=A0A1V4B1Y5_9PAST|nr:hypothetical protein [Canicola haemoglobinophilus]OOS01241.1 hypothetical protein B0186_03955 [Canicola haemoglobinophilus]STO54454.1 Uncharacterised protein [Canicola haemoglobinophilus]STO60080.1 Uncharacterised protein [Canicola haemoglobinophilus]STO68988.1 Uncharacterised protein [Canicola haemoglobinophilus]
MTTLITKGEQVPELIVCAAVRFFNICDPSIEIDIPSVRHMDTFTHSILEQFSYDEWRQKEQGFLTNKMRFVSRKEALEIAKANNQIRRDIGYESKELYSEMLY